MVLPQERTGIDPKVPTFVEIQNEFGNSLGYVRQDIRWLVEQNSRLQYTVALLVSCGCEMLASCRGDKFRKGESVFGELLPAGDWQALAKKIYSALRNGLAHGFDTRHILVDGQEHQMYFEWECPDTIATRKSALGLRVVIGTRALAQALCAKIDEYEILLKTNEVARKRFMEARQCPAKLTVAESEAWRSLVAGA